MSEELVRLEATGATAYLTIDRPGKRNALNARVREQILAHLERLRQDPTVRVVVITGEGDTAFAAGADISELAGRTPLEQRDAMSALPLFEAIARFPKPTLAMINGLALGGGCELALACDLRIASDTARLGQPEIELALIPGGGGTQRLAHLAGLAAAMRLVLTGEIITAPEALRLGIVDYVAPAAELRATTDTLASRIATRSPIALRLAKEAVRAAAECHLSAGLALERELFLAAFATDDRREGLNAFLEKRAPGFTGR
jgi:enoyl-CoA hydratase